MPPSRGYRMEEELLLKEWSERAMVYRVLHHKAWSAYKRSNYQYSIPIIVLSSLAGTANVAQSRIPESYLAVATVAIGIVNLIAAILTTLHNFFQIAKLEQAHLTASVQWGKYSREWSTQLSRQPADRVPVQEAMRQAKTEFDRLIELSPPIPDEITIAFTKEKVARLPEQFARPEIVDGFREVRVFGSSTQVTEVSPRLLELRSIASSMTSDTSRPNEIDL